MAINNSRRQKPPKLLKTDLGNAQRLARDHGPSLRYVEAWRKWLTWNGRNWSDRQSDAQAVAKRNAMAMLEDASSTDNDRERRDLITHAEASQSASRIRAALYLTQSEPGIAIRSDQLDASPWLLNVENGTIDLRTGTLLPHRRDDLLTKLCPTPFIPEATCPIWDTFIQAVFDGDAELICFVQKLLGYCLTGDVGEQILTILHGSGANGKSTLLNVIMEVLGEDYAMKAPRNLLMARGGKMEHSTELTDLFGKRLVAAVETEDGRRLSETLVKELTGSDKIRARRMREDNWQFSPTHKLLLATNHRPEVRGTDHAIWRRLVLVPFNQTFSADRQDKQLPSKLRAEHPGILAWCVRGCLQWLADGLAAPTAVDSATAVYRDEQDTVGAFLADCCVIKSEASGKASELYAAYKAWCDANGENVIIGRQFGERMTGRGFQRYRNNGVCYRGVGLINGTNGTNGT